MEHANPDGGPIAGGEDGTTDYFQEFQPESTSSSLWAETECDHQRAKLPGAEDKLAEPNKHGDSDRNNQSEPVRKSQPRSRQPTTDAPVIPFAQPHFECGKVLLQSNQADKIAVDPVIDEQGRKKEDDLEDEYQHQSQAQVIVISMYHERKQAVIDRRGDDLLDADGGYKPYAGGAETGQNSLLSRPYNVQVHKYHSMSRWFAQFCRLCYKYSLYSKYHPLSIRVKINHQIKAPELRVITAEGENLGVISLSQALLEAEKRTLDLIEISPSATPPIAKIMDYGKYLYDEKKKTKLAKTKTVVTEVKNVQVKIGTGEHDLELKAKRISEWLAEGNRVKVDLFLVGRAKYMDIKFLKERLDRVLKLVTVEYKIAQDVTRGPKGLTIYVEKK